MAAVPSDEAIRAMAFEKMRELGEPAALFISGVIDLPGLEPPPHPTGAAYTAAILPFDLPAAARQAARSMSSCGLTTEIGWRFARVVGSLLYVAYLPRAAAGGVGYAVSYEKHLAERAGCWVDCTVWREHSQLPLEGDAPIIGCQSCGPNWGRGGGQSEHEFTIVAWGPDGLCHSVDGGQPGIAFRSRAMVEVWTGSDAKGRTGELWCASVDKHTGIPALSPDGRPVKGRRMMGYTRVAGLPLHGDGGPALAGGGTSYGRDAKTGEPL